MTDEPDARIDAAVADAFHAEWGRVVASLIRMTRDWDLAEECAQDAFVQAVRRWPRDGVPSRPGGWLTTVARNRALDRLRRSVVEAAKLEQAGRLLPTPDTGDEEPDDGGIPDDRLRLIFTCCHPALAGGAEWRSLCAPRGADHAGNRPRLPGAGGHPGQAARPSQAQDPGRGIPSGSRPPSCSASGQTGSSPSSTSSSTRATRRPPGRT